MPTRTPSPRPPLNDLSLRELRGLWEEAFGTLPLSHILRDHLVCSLTYHQQEIASGGIRPATRRQLAKLAQNLAAGSSPDLLNSNRVKAGTRLVREWKGRTHEVIVVEDGFRYGGKEYRSLSVIARLITGTRWSGPVFFGLKRSDSSAPRSPIREKSLGGTA